MSLNERSYRLRCIALEAELERMKKEKDNDILPYLLEVLDNHPEAKAEMINRVEKMGKNWPVLCWDETTDLAAITDDELERRARAILEKRDRMRAEGKL